MSKLFEPVTIGHLTLKNPLVMSPMVTQEADPAESQVTAFHQVHYGARALGGVGLIMLEGTAVRSDGRIYARDLGLWNDQQAAALQELVSQLHAWGSKVGIQLNHAGRKSQVGEGLWAPSALAFDETLGTPQALTLEEMAAIKAAFVRSAQYAQAAGIDVIELHLAHGYLLNEFWSPLTNQRTDAYGGSLANRYRYIHEIIEAVQAVFEGSLWARISADEYDVAGSSLDDMIQLARWLQADGIELVDVSTGGVISRRPSAIYPGYQVPYAHAIKSATGLPVGAVGLLNSPQLVVAILEQGQADVVSLGRPLLNNPNWLTQAARELGHLEALPVYNDAYERGKRI